MGDCWRRPRMANSSTRHLLVRPSRPPRTPARCIGTIHPDVTGRASPVVPPVGAGRRRVDIRTRPPPAGRCVHLARARTTVGGGLRAAAARTPRRRARGTGRPVRGLRREPVPVPGREVPRRAHGNAVSALPPGAADPGQLRLRRRARPGVRAGEETGRAGPDGRRPGRVLRVHRRGLPRLRLEPPRPLLRPGCRTGAGTLATPDPPPGGDRVVPRPARPARRTGLTPALGAGAQSRRHTGWSPARRTTSDLQERGPPRASPRRDLPPRGR